MMTMPSFQHITPPLRLFHGPDSLGQLGRELDRLKSGRAVIFCGPWMMKDRALLDRVQSAIGEHCAGVFSDVEGHSPVSSVEAAAKVLKRLRADAVIAVGGGSVMVTARAASILLAEGKSPRQLCTVINDKGVVSSPKLLAPKLPQLIIPTTPTTATVKAGSAVFDPVDGERLAMYDPKTRAQSVFIDPQMLLSAPRGLVASASLNTLSMAIEGLTSRMSDPLADALLMHALRLLVQHLADPEKHDDPTVRGELVLAAIMCGQGTDHTSAGITTVLGHAIGARYGSENGIINAIVLPHVLAFNALASGAGLSKVAAALGLQSSASGSDQVATTIETVRTILAGLGVPRGLREVGVAREDLPAIARLAMGDWFLRGNPRTVQDAGELQQLMEDAW
jgi:alcohol dehydrogenase